MRERRETSASREQKELLLLSCFLTLSIMLSVDSESVSCQGFGRMLIQITFTRSRSDSVSQSHIMISVLEQMIVW